MSNRGVTAFNNDQVCFALVADDPSLDLEEVEPMTLRNLRNCVRFAMRRTFDSETDHTLYVLVNNRYWLTDPLTHIEETVELEGGSIRSVDLSKRTFTIYTKDDHPLEIIIIGEGRKPEGGVEDVEEEVVVDMPEENGVIEIIDAPDKKETPDKKEVIEILDTSADNDSETECEDEKVGKKPDDACFVLCIFASNGD